MNVEKNIIRFHRDGYVGVALALSRKTRGDAGIALPIVMRVGASGGAGLHLRRSAAYAGTANARIDASFLAL